ncbi:MAG: hypothetical protein KDA33_05075 [Phycisphaerales bacterium]|nr:hypothetical protein [Phycisphaerales bacterium]
MGSGLWSAATHFDRNKAHKVAGVDTFEFSRRAHATGQFRVHQTLDPYGLTLRESRDSEEHPDSNAVVISLDVTGSMDRVVRGIHRNLPQLHELLLGHKYIPHPQILFAAVGDATCDRAPLQVGQFESDNRMDQNLENMILEGGGGGQKTESYELTMYLAARHTAMDCWEKRGRKGYLFMIGDEMAYPEVRRAHIQRIIGVDPQADIPIRQIVAEVLEKYHFFFIIPGKAAHGGDRDVQDFWVDLLGRERVLILNDAEDTSECIAMTIGLTEGVIRMDQAQQHLASRGKSGGALQRLIDAIAGIFGGGAGTPPTASGPRRL